ncbi:hypothetical protein AU359_02064 [Micrococcus luteus]|nr:hypothetical protein AU359_02064 [Micrococcus luteus]
MRGAEEPLDGVRHAGRLGHGPVFEAREDRPAVVVDDHEVEVRLGLGGAHEQAARLVQGGEVAEQGHGPPPARQCDARGRGDGPVDPGEPAVGVHLRVRRRGGPPGQVHVPDHRGRAQHERTPDHGGAHVRHRLRAEPVAGVGGDEHVLHGGLGAHRGVLPRGEPAGLALPGEGGELLEGLHGRLPAPARLEPRCGLGGVQGRGDVGAGQQGVDRPGERGPAEQHDPFDAGGQGVCVRVAPAGRAQQERIGGDGVGGEPRVRGRLGQQGQAQGQREGRGRGAGTVAGQHDGAPLVQAGDVQLGQPREHRPGRPVGRRGGGRARAGRGDGRSRGVRRRGGGAHGGRLLRARHERVAEVQVQVDGSGRGLGHRHRTGRAVVGTGLGDDPLGRQQGPAHGGPHVPQMLLGVHAVGRVAAEGGGKADVRAEHLPLVRGLVRAGAVQLGRTIRGQRDHARAGVEGLHQGGHQVPDGGARGGQHAHRAPRGQREPVGEEAGRTLVHPHVQADLAGVLEGRERVGQRGGAGAGADHRVPHAGVDQGGGDGARHGEGVDGGHGGHQSRPGRGRAPDAARPPR